MLCQEKSQILLTRRLDQIHLKTFSAKSHNMQGGNAARLLCSLQEPFKSFSKTISLSTGNCTADFDSILAGMNALTYVADYLLKKSLLKHSCEMCRKELVNNQLTDSSQLLCMFKAYDETTEKPFGRLLSPKKHFMKYIAGVKAKFVEQFESNLDVKKYLLSKLSQFTAVQCECFPSTSLLKLFIRIRIHYALKFGNKELCSTKEKNMKFLKVSHL